MADYRGGERRTSVYGERLIKDIRDGQTEAQAFRNIMQKLVMAGVQGGLQMGRGLASAAHSRNQQNKAKADAWAHRAADERDKQDRWRDNWQKSFAVAGREPLPDYKATPDGTPAAELPAWLNGQVLDQGKVRAVEAQSMGNPLDAPSVTDVAFDKQDEDEPTVTWGSGSKGRGMMRSQ